MSSAKETIYTVASSFRAYKTELEGEYESGFSLDMGECNEFTSDYLNGTESAKTCHLAVKYLLHLKESVNIPYIDKGCKYLFYWIHGKVVKNEKSIENTLKLYNIFRQKYEDYDETIKFDKYLEHFSNDMLDRLIRLFELYVKFSTFERKSTPSCEKCECANECAKLYDSYVDECHKGNDYDFCNELENFKETYENNMKNADCPEGVQKILRPIKTHNIVLIILIPLIFILVKSFVLFILYKFTPFGFRIRTLLNRKKSIYNSLNQETDKLLYTSEKLNKNSENSNFSLSYHSLEYS
ncbi:PIR Superfamily Protein [Plasmodium ovale wallikeri]|uniref:PIR Superfamily Protein n=1 Tax=Plasmodium ovale wallikeri TaxID=864142 RepID=A0A1A9AP59_PLAOA|nr:PIR Superfamily Protein [Plasmodium ovale wallikeri]